MDDLINFEQLTSAASPSPQPQQQQQQQQSFPPLSPMSSSSPQYAEGNHDGNNNPAIMDFSVGNLSGPSFVSDNNNNNSNNNNHHQQQQQGGNNNMPPIFTGMQQLSALQNPLPLVSSAPQPQWNNNGANFGAPMSLGGANNNNYNNNNYNYTSSATDHNTTNFMNQLFFGNAATAGGGGAGNATVDMNEQLWQLQQLLVAASGGGGQPGRMPTSNIMQGIPNTNMWPGMALPQQQQQQQQQQAIMNFNNAMMNNDPNSNSNTFAFQGQEAMNTTTCANAMKDAEKMTTQANWSKPFAGKGKKREPPFPLKLHQILANSEFSDCICWNPHGKSWRIQNPPIFEQLVIPLYFRHGKYSSFMRQVNGYGFQRVTSGDDHNSYYHELFVRDSPQLCLQIKRFKRAGSKKSQRVKDSAGVDGYQSDDEDDHEAPSSSDITSGEEGAKLGSISSQQPQLGQLKPNDTTQLQSASSQSGAGAAGLAGMQNLIQRHSLQFLGPPQGGTMTMATPTPNNNPAVVGGGGTQQAFQQQQVTSQNDDLQRVLNASISASSGHPPAPFQNNMASLQSIANRISSTQGLPFLQQSSQGNMFPNGPNAMLSAPAGGYVPNLMQQQQQYSDSSQPSASKTDATQTASMQQLIGGMDASTILKLQEALSQTHQQVMGSQFFQDQQTHDPSNYSGNKVTLAPQQVESNLPVGSLKSLNNPSQTSLDQQVQETTKNLNSQSSSSEVPPGQLADSSGCEGTGSTGID